MSSGLKGKKVYHEKFGRGVVIGDYSRHFNVDFGGRKMTFEKDGPHTGLTFEDDMKKDRDPSEVLKRYYGYTSFKTGQREIIDSILGGRDVLCVMPTGAGKSVCYQIPAIIMDGLTIVISPLISLMKDQVEGLAASGIRAGYINSTQRRDDQERTMDEVRRGAITLLYAAPERLAAPAFRKLCRDVPVSFVAVDEAHCVSQWGQDFRPSYLEIEKFIESLPERPVTGAFTATATGEVRRDIERLLDLRDPFTVTTGFDRPNLAFYSYRTDSKDSLLMSLLRKRGDDPGIIYCLTRKKVEAVSDMLCRKGIKAAPYHAGLPSEERRRNQDDFINDRIRIVVATNAFGMGIDKSNVSFVIHYSMPRSIENYYQEAGRAGRDGSPAVCILLHNDSDMRLNRFLINSGAPNPALTADEQEEVRKRDFERLDRMKGYATSTTCLRKYILNYFGEDAPDSCGNCSVCRGTRVQRRALDRSAIARCVASTGEKYGITMIADILRGGAKSASRSPGLSSDPHYGMMSDRSADEIKEAIREMIDEGYLVQDGTRYPVLKTSYRSSGMLEGRRAFDRRMDGTLFDRLKEYRTAKARVKSLPPYTLFSDKVLQDICVTRPESLGALCDVDGMTRRKIEEYGSDILAIVEDFI